MNVLWVLAHPEPRSLTGTLATDGQAALAELGHAVLVSDLYAMKWDPVIRPGEYGGDLDERLFVGSASRRAYDTGALPRDVIEEHDKLEWADGLVVQFPLWWFGMPAILKGWVDRVLVEGFAYGIRDEQGRTRRYGDGPLAAKRALVVTSSGGPASAFGPRGINGDIEELLFPLLHGTLFYAGAEVLPPLLIAGADRFTERDGAQARLALRERLARFNTESPIPYRTQRGGDYDDQLTLLPDIVPGAAGLAVHAINKEPARSSPSR